MRAKRNGDGFGNVRKEAKVESAEQKAQDIRPGDIVALTPTALRMPRLSTMSPRVLVDLGFANEFQVLQIFDSDEDGPCAILSECCGRRVDRRTGRPVCIGHPMMYFRRAEPSEASRRARRDTKNDRSSAVSLPFLGEVASMEYEEDEKRPRLTVKIGGRSMM